MARLPRVAGAPNPYASLLDEQVEARGHPVQDAPALNARWLWRARRSVGYLHFHWRPDLYYALVRRTLPPPRLQGPRSWLRLPGFAARLAAARLLGYRIVWTIHEVYPPEDVRRPPGAISRRLDRAGGRLLAHFSQALVALDGPVARAAHRELGLGARRIEIIPHGSYEGVYPPGRLRAETRAALGIAPDAFAFLCFGQLRSDKEIDLVLDAFSALEGPGYALIVAGSRDDARSDALVTAAAERDPRICSRPGRVPDAEVAELHAAADAAVVARGTEWTSGSAILALSLGLPLVAADSGVHRALLGDGDAGWLFPSGDQRALRSALSAAAAERESAAARSRAASALAAGLPGWDEAGARLVAVLEAPRASGGRSADRR